MLRKTLLVLILPFLLYGCAYRPPVQQGNILTISQINKVKVGMSLSSVREILGAPILRNIYYNDQLVYVYTYQTSRRDFTKRRLIIYFKGNRVRDIETDFGDKPIPYPID